MSFLDEAKREINLKIVYYGPGLVGKTTNLQYVYERTDPARKGKMISLATETDRVLFFDFLPATLAEVRGYKPRFHLYTVPGPIFYDKSRAMVLKGVDGVVFVADSQVERAEANVESLEGLESNLAIHGYDFEKVPLVLQYNKRDLPEIATPAEMDEMLNENGRARFEAVARLGTGVFDTLKAIAKQALEAARTRAGATS